MLQYDQQLKELAAEYVMAVPDMEKTPEAEYNRRLGICSECCYLVEGLCILCGCYVEIRAAKAAQSCASGHWQRYRDD